MFYQWEELYPTFSPRFPANWDAYVKMKEAEKTKDFNPNNPAKPSTTANLSSTGLESGAFVNSGSFKISESMLLQIPDFNLVSLEGDNKNLPIGWYLNNLGN